MSNIKGEKISAKPKARATSFDLVIAKRLKMRRLAVGVTQEHLGKAAGVSIQQIQKYERGLNRISCGKINDFAIVLGVPASYFFRDELSDDEANFLYSATEKQLVSLDKALSDEEFLSFMRDFNRIPSRELKKLVLAIVRILAKFDD